MIDDFFIGKLGYIYQIPENKWCIPGSYFHKISLKVNQKTIQMYAL